jgi:hypothetical protein
MKIVETNEFAKDVIRIMRSVSTKYGGKCSYKHCSQASKLNS